VLQAQQHQYDQEEVAGDDEAPESNEEA